MAEVVSTTMRVTRACAEGALASAAVTTAASPIRLNADFMCSRPLSIVVVVAVVVVIVLAAPGIRLARSKPRHGGQHAAGRGRHAAREARLHEAVLFERGVLAQEQAVLDHVVQRSA